MKRYILLFLSFMLLWTSFSQTQRDVYLIVTTTSGATNAEDQIIRSSVYNKALHKSPTLIFRARSLRKHIHEDFIHANYRDESVSKNEPMAIKILSVAVLKEINPVDLNSYLKASDEKTFRNFCLKLRDHTIYIIDRNEIKGDSLKAIEVKYIRHLNY